MASPEEERAAEIAALISLLKQLFATCLIGFAVATTLYGVSVLQTFLYYRVYTKDHWALKSTVAALWILDTLTTIFVAHSLYVYYVLNFGQSPTVNLIIPWSFSTEKMLVTVITFIAQLFYAHTLWKVSRNIPIVLVIVVLAVASFALGIVTTVHLFQDPLATSIAAPVFSIISGLVQGFAALNDIVITVSLCYFLQGMRSGISSTGQIIDNLILYSVSRGTLTAITQILFLVLNVALPHDTYWQPFHQVVGKLYVNSVLATLNVRKTLSATEDKGDDESNDIQSFRARTRSLILSPSTDDDGFNTTSLHTDSLVSRPKIGIEERLTPAMTRNESNPTI